MDSEYLIEKANYGKSNVKLLHVLREGRHHSIREFEVDTKLSLNTKVDYLTGDNKQIVATDSQKNIVYVMAKRYGLDTPENFAILLCNFFLTKYQHVNEATIHIQQYPWKRMEVNGVPHNHSFIMTPTAVRFTTVKQSRRGQPIVTSGIKGLQVLKTTQSAFVDFVQDEFRTLPDAEDRIVSTLVTSKWTYSDIKDLDFDKAWNTIQECIIEKFAGGPEVGIYSPSVQKTLYDSEHLVLDRVPQVESIEMDLPNKHYIDLDLTKFPADLVGPAPNKNVFVPIDKPSGLIHAKLVRGNKSKL